LKNDKNKKNNENFIFNITLKQLCSFFSALGIKEYNKEINTLIKELNNHKFIKIINILFQKKEAFNFLLSITSKDCRNIQELAGEVHGGNNQNFLSIEELLTIEKIVESFEDIEQQIKDENNKNKNEDEINI